MPSNKSPRVISWYSASPLSTFNKRFSSRTPVWMRSTTISSPAGGAAAAGLLFFFSIVSSKASATNVHWYIHTNLCQAGLLRMVPSPSGMNDAPPHIEEIGYYILEAPPGNPMKIIQINHAIVDDEGFIYANDRSTGGLYVPR